MNSTNVSSQGLDEKMRTFSEKQALLKKQKERTRRRKNRRNKEIIGCLLVITFILCLYAFSLLFNDSSHGHAMEREQLPESKLTVDKVESSEVVPLAKASEKIEEKKKLKQVKVSEVKVEAPPQQQGVYNPNIPMPKEHQEYLYKLTKKHGLDFKKTLAVIKHESKFDANVVNETHDYGYFQVNQINHPSLSKKLGTPNQPLDPYINMQWGTYMLADLYTYWSQRGYSGQGLDDAVWSSYNRGLGGFKKNGYATEYIQKMKGAIVFVQAQY